MKNILKSYFKLFIKLWVETIGVIAFLTIFTMLVVGMLATPLQLTMKTSSIENKTNLWNQQRQTIPALTNDFINNYFINYDVNTDKEIKLNNENYSITINTPEGGFFTKDSLTRIEEYAEYSKTHDAKYFCEETSVGNENQDCINEFVESSKIDLARSLIDSFYYYGDEHSLTIADGSDIEPLLVKDIFTNNGSWLNINNWSTRSVEDFIIYNIIKNIDDDKMDYNSFMNVVYNEPIQGTENQSYEFLLTSSTSLEYDYQTLNNLILEDINSRLPEINSEVVVSDSYAKNFNKKIGDEIEIKGKNFKIVGFGNKYSTLTPTYYSPFSTSIENYVQVYMKNSFFYETNDSYSFKNLFLTNNFETSNISGKMFRYYYENYVNFNDNNINLNNLLTNYIENGKPSLENELKGTSIFSPGASPFKDISQHKNISELNNLFIMTYIYLAIGVILFVLGFCFVIFILKKEINNTRNQLGVFKALGYRTNQLTWIFALKNFVSMSISIIIGYLLSFPFQIDSAEKQFKSLVTFKFDYIYHDPIFIILLVVLIPLTFSLFAYFIIFRVLNASALDLIQKQTKRNKKSYFILSLQVLFFPFLIFTLINYLILNYSKKYNKWFSFKLQNAFVSDNKGKFLLIVSLFGISAFLFTTQLKAIPVLKNMFESGYNIYNKDVNHYYNFRKVNNVKYSDSGLMRNNILPDYKISYSDIEEDKEKYIKENILYSGKISLLADSISNFRNKVLNNEDLKEYKAYLNILCNTTFLMYPLNFDDTSIDVEKWIKENLLPLLLTSDENEIKEKVDKILISSPNLLTIKPIEGDKNTGIYTNDIAKYVCVSLPDYNGDCNNVNEFRTYAKNINNKTSFNNFNEQANTNEQFPVISTALRDWISAFILSDSSINPFIAANKVLFDKQRELLTLNLKFFVENNQDVDVTGANIILTDTNNNYGNPKIIFNWSSISDDAYKSLLEDNKNYTNGLISYRLSRLLNLGVGDTFEINVGQTTHKELIKVSGIIDDNTLLEEIYVDYNVMMNKVGKSIISNRVVFSNLYSTMDASEGEIDLTNIRKSIDTFKNKRDLFSYASTTKKPWLASNLDLYLNQISKTSNSSNSIFDNLKKAAKYINDNYLEAPYNQSFFINPGVITLPILKELIDSILGEVQKSLLTYVIIDIFLLTILLIVLMNVIINDAINIITVMRSMGYTNKKINWMIMGKYIVYSFIGFLIGYGMSVVLWYLIQYIVWMKFKVAVIIPTLVWIPFVSAIVLGTILYIGWLAATIQIKKKPLTLLIT
ncbi:ABC transporter permease [Spiroplasma corruscae]|uniref:ABC transporter permease n=1 Tax=Spiroplasma corruscae TaxID=216934 RepID=A0A222EN87_9MOLU|nr:FtsX-like permease family protein [Spiroplasma corruscae]ASP27960.1 ABC transporter permease [Spiroplasma corruscae]